MIGCSEELAVSRRCDAGHRRGGQRRFLSRLVDRPPSLQMAPGSQTWLPRPRRALCRPTGAHARHRRARLHRRRPAHRPSRGVDRLQHGVPRVRLHRREPRHRRGLGAQVLVLREADGARAVARGARVRAAHAAQPDAHRRGDRGAADDPGRSGRGDRRHGAGPRAAGQARAIRALHLRTAASAAGTGGRCAGNRPSELVLAC